MAKTGLLPGARGNFRPIAKVRQRVMHKWSNGRGLLGFQALFVIGSEIALLVVFHKMGWSLLLAFGCLYPLLQLAIAFDARPHQFKQPERYLKDSVVQRVQPTTIVNDTRVRPRLPWKMRGTVYVRAPMEGDDHT